MKRPPEALHDINVVYEGNVDVEGLVNVGKNLDDWKRLQLDVNANINAPRQKITVMIFAIILPVSQAL